MNSQDRKERGMNELTNDELKTLEELLRKFRDDSVDRDEWDKRESLRFDVALECECRDIPINAERGGAG